MKVSTKPLPVVACPTCGRPARWHADNPSRPFCSARCKEIDLGNWATERYSIPAHPGPAQEED